MENKHTPGEWFTSRPTSFGTIYIECRLRGTTLQEIASVGPTETREHQEANARLIAAAPTMYGYLEQKAADGDEEASAILGGIHANT